MIYFLLWINNPEKRIKTVNVKNKLNKYNYIILKINYIFKFKNMLVKYNNFS